MLGGLLGLLALATFTPSVAAHTWVEQLMVIAPNGTMVGQPGFPRGNVLRTTPGFGDPAMVNLIPPDGRPANQIQPQDLMCKTTQTSQSQSDGSPRLQAGPGSAVGLRYQENGHVTLPATQAGKPQNRGTVYVYGTEQPSPDDSFLAIHRVWNAEGSGGDRRGVLLSTQNFDDGQCYQINGGQISGQRQQQYGHPFNSVMGSDLWCQQDIQIPTTAPSGKPYTLYWVWDWPTLPGTPGFPEGKQEIYTTCMDVDIVSNVGVEAWSKALAGAWQDQPVDDAAIKVQMADIDNPAAVTGQTIPFSATPTFSQPAPSSSSEVLTSSSTGSTIAFSASATGPAAGAASDASVSFATQVSTGEPGFLTVHTGSTAGPGVETQTFTVQPIAETAPPQHGGGGGGGGGGRGEILIEIPRESAGSIKLMIHVNQTGPQVTSVPAVNNQAGVLTLTEYDSVTETVYETVYQTQYTKRDTGESESFTISPVEYPTTTGGPLESESASASGNGAAPFHHGRPGWGHGGHSSGGPSENITWGQHNNGSRSAWVATRTSAASSSGPTDTGYIMTMPDGTVMTVPADAESLLSNAAYTTMDSAVPTIVPRDEAMSTPEVIAVDPSTFAYSEAMPTVTKDQGPAHPSHASNGGAFGTSYSHGHASGSGAFGDSHPTNCTSTWKYARRSAIPHHPHGGKGGQGFQPTAQGTGATYSAYANHSGLRPDAKSSGASHNTFLSLEPGVVASASSYNKRFASQNHLLTTSYAVPEVTAAPSIDIRASQPEPASTEHSAFRLRARNPFIWLGWTTDGDEKTQPTPTSHP